MNADIELVPIPIAGLEHVRASADGRIWALERRGTRLIQPWLMAKGYERVTFSFGPMRGYPESKIKHFQVHRLIAYAFLGPPATPDLMVRHLDGNKRNNIPSNLAWGTALENCADGKRLGERATGPRHGSRTKPERRPRGERSNLSKLTTAQVVEIKRRLKLGQTCPSLSREFSVGKRAIYHISRGDNWKHVDEFGNMLIHAEQRMSNDASQRAPRRRDPERVARGERSGTSKLSESQVLLIKQRLLAGERQPVIARDYNVDHSTISMIACGKRWRHVVLPSHQEERSVDATLAKQPAKESA